MGVVSPGDIHAREGARVLYTREAGRKTLYIPLITFESKISEADFMEFKEAIKKKIDEQIDGLFDNYNEFHTWEEENEGELDTL